MKCPNCNKDIDEEYIEKHLKIHQEEVLNEIKISKEKTKELQKNLETKNKELQEKEVKIIADAEKKAKEKIQDEFKAKEVKIIADAEKKAQEKQEKIISDIEKRTKQKVESEFTLKQDKKNKEHQIEKERLAKKMGDLKRRLDETGNVELKGEAQEQLIEEFLREKFSHFGDTVEPIKKGQSGADNILNIFYKEKKIDSLYIESKDTKSFEPSWIPKLINDMKAKNIEDGILITRTLPENFNDKKTASYTDSGIEIIPMDYRLMHAVISGLRKDIINRNLMKIKQSSSNSNELEKNTYNYISGSKTKLYVRKKIRDYIKLGKNYTKLESLSLKIIDEVNDAKFTTNEILTDIRKYYTELSSIDRKSLNVLKEIESEDDKNRFDEDND